MTRAVVAVLLVIAAGCLGAGADDDRVETSGDTVTAYRGAVEGVVTDTAVRPLGGARITLLETNDTVRTSDTGFFEIGQLVPGRYTVVARAEGHVPGSIELDVHAGEAAIADFLLTPLISELPYTQQYEFGGFIEVGGTAFVNITGVYGPYFAPWERCDVEQPDPNDAFGLNACGSLLELDPPVHTLVYELVWQPGSPLAARMAAFVAVQRTDYSWGPDDIFVYVDAEGPIVARADREEFVRVSEAYVAACEGGDDTHCGYGFWDGGWPVQTIVIPSGQCVTPLIGACAMVQQQYTEYISIFYNAPAPEGFSVSGGASV